MAEEARVKPPEATPDHTGGPETGFPGASGARSRRDLKRALSRRLSPRVRGALLWRVGRKTDERCVRAAETGAERHEPNQA